MSFKRFFSLKIKAHPEISDVYTQHSCQVNVAKYAPSGFYIASADKSGKVRLKLKNLLPKKVTRVP